MRAKHLAAAAIITSTIVGSVALAPSWLFQDSKPQIAEAATGSTIRYDIGTPTVVDIWVSPNGSDNNDGSATAPVQTLDRAWQMIPANQVLSSGYRIRFMSGTYPSSGLPNYMENRLGTAQAPVILQAEGDVKINGNLNIFNVKYFYIIGLNFTSANDVLHFEKSEHVLVRDVVLYSPNRSAQETIKINQSQYIYIEDSDISGAHDNAIDMVAVQYGHIVGNKVHDAQDWCAYTKGGSAYFIVEGNEFYNCGTGGFTAGQGTGIQFMTAPWVQYEAYDIKVYNNIIHDIEGAGLGVNGGYNILLANNTMYRVGARDHVIEVVFGLHTCDGGDAAACSVTLNAGGWGSSSGEDVFVSNKNVYIYNNIVYNPSGYRSQWTQFAIYAPRSNTISGTRGPTRAITDDNLQIKGNIIWNGPNAVELGVGGDQGCLDSNPTCNTAQILRDNAINTIQPQFTNAIGLDFTLPATSTVFSAAKFAIPSFSWNDATNNVPTGTTTNIINKDYFNTIRGDIVAGAITGIGVSIIPTLVPTQTPSPTASNSPTPTLNPTTTPVPTATSVPSTPQTIAPIPTNQPLSDLEGYWNNVDKVCRTSGGIKTCTLNSTIHPFNAGDVRTPATKIHVYLSADSMLDSSDTLIKTLDLKSLRSGTGTSVRFSYRGVMNPTQTPYLIGKFDATNVAVETDEDDNLAIYYPL